MDDLSAARKRKYFAALSGNGWKVTTHEGAGDLVPIWLYSYNLTAGPRITGQLSRGGYLGASEGIGFEDLGDAHPGDIYQGGIRHFDRLLPVETETVMVRDAFMGVMLNYVRSLQSWKALPPLRDLLGRHFVVLDWVSAGGNQLVAPACVVRDGVLSPDDLDTICASVLRTHLAKHPGDIPAGWPVI